MFRWYVINTYSGHENKVKTNLEHRVKSMSKEEQVRRVVVPTESVVETKDGDQFYGIPRAETAKHLTIQQGDGQPVIVDKSKITSRRVLNESAMPSNFNELMSPQEVTDVVAWLLTLKKPLDGNAPPADEN